MIIAFNFIADLLFDVFIEVRSTGIKHESLEFGEKPGSTKSTKITTGTGSLFVAIKCGQAVANMPPSTQRNRSIKYPV